MSSAWLYLCLIFIPAVKMELVVFRKSTKFLNSWIVPRPARVLNSSQLTLAQCGRTCAANLACLSFFYNHETWHCQTHDVVFRSPKDGARTTGSQYFVAEHENCKMEEDLVYSRALNMCLWINRYYYNWEMARDACSNATGLQLVTLNSEAKYKFVVNILKSSSVTAERNFIIGLSDIEKGGRLRWVDLSDIGWKVNRWYPGSPNPKNKRHCFAIRGKAKGKYRLWDLSTCFDTYANKYRSICEVLL